MMNGEQAALTLASELGITITDDQVSILIYTTGDSGLSFVDPLKKLGIENLRATSLNNVVQVFAPIGELLNIAEQDYVLFISPTFKLTGS